MTNTTRILAALLVGLAPAAGAAVGSEPPSPAAEEVPVHIETCRGAMDELGKALKARLLAAMADGGPGGALSVCSEEAAAIADSVGSARGLLVGRTSLRTRNPRNAPDDWERGILLDFAARREQGEKISDLDAWTFESDEDGHRTFRYMRAIVTAPPCLECHGHDLAPEAAAGLAELYPEDTAIGFAVGDIRGAFTTSLPLLD